MRITSVHKELVYFLEALKAIEAKPPGDTWRLRLNGQTAPIQEPVNRVALGIIREIKIFLEKAGLKPTTVADFLAARDI
jgi:hypothetical protein